ncbi:imidazole glycerol phosphate synthase subunit HisH [Bacteroidota bacterium]
MIYIVDYGMGNLGSVKNMLRYISVESKITNNPEDIKNANKIILPGVGSFDMAMKRIEESGFREVLDKKALKEKVPLLGICLGMQLLTNGSEEGKLSGLGWIPANTVRFPRDNGLKVPHMGWNLVEQSYSSQLTYGLPEVCRYYFVHSYYVRVENETNSILKTNYGIDFDSAIQKENIYGVQFHPEKSHKFGMQLLKNFSTI